MLRNITPAQKSAWEFYKSDALAQTNQINYDYFYRMHGKYKNFFFSKSKSTKKIPGQVFLDFILLLHNAVERFF